MSIVNINDVCFPLKEFSHLQFGSGSPRMHIHKCDDYTILVFSSGKCRIMGCKIALTSSDILPFGVTISRIQSITVTFKLNMMVNLPRLARAPNCSWEPEIFPALRLLDFNPLCVNVFGSGKVVILGIRNLRYKKIIRRICKFVYKHI